MFDQEEDDGLDEIKSLLSQAEEKEKRKEELLKNANMFFEQISKDPRLLQDEAVSEDRKETLLENMINLFVETEEYEKCGTIQGWKQYVKKNAKKSFRTRN
jgi:hypothetical protein